MSDTGTDILDPQKKNPDKLYALHEIWYEHELMSPVTVQSGSAELCV